MSASLRIALVYDFDGTLSAGNMQEVSLLPSLGVQADEFWREVHALAQQRDEDPTLVYMRRLVEVARDQGAPLTRAALQGHGRELALFPGVLDWFERTTAWGSEHGLLIEHYLVSSGNAEILEGHPIHAAFSRVFASRYSYDAQGHASWPAAAINATNKTQFLFRINKGALNHHDTRALNAWIEPSQREIPFERMVFIGDGDTDIPSMKAVRNGGGTAIAVYDEAAWPAQEGHGARDSHDEAAMRRLHQLIEEDRVDFVAPADYRANRQLEVIVRGVVLREARRARAR